MLCQSGPIVYIHLRYRARQASQALRSAFPSRWRTAAYLPPTFLAAEAACTFCHSTTSKLICRNHTKVPLSCPRTPSLTVRAVRLRFVCGSRAVGEWRSPRSVTRKRRQGSSENILVNKRQNYDESLLRPTIIRFPDASWRAHYRLRVEAQIEKAEPK